MEQSGLLADTITQLQAYLTIAEDQLHLQQNDINKVRFIIAALRDESDVSTMLVELEKMKMKATSQHGMTSPSNGHQDLDATHLKDRYLGSIKQWITETVTASTTPLTPGQVFRMGREAGIKMHKNYPYVALKQLAKSKVLKQVGRGYAGLDFTETERPGAGTPGRSERMVRHDLHNPTNQRENDHPTVHR